MQHILTSTKSILLVVVVATYILITPAITQAFFEASPVDINGWAWSSTIGWIAMSGTNDDGSTHQVVINTDGTVTGYAWSENIGWIKFGGLSSFPSGGGTSAQNAQLQPIGGNNYRIQGWARACAGTAPGDCSTMASRADGWDGWISLAGTAADGSPYGVQIAPSGPVAGSYAWGGNVVGWVDMFSHVTFESLPNAIIEVPAPCSVALGDSSCTASVDYSFLNTPAGQNPEVRRITPLPETDIATGLIGPNPAGTISGVEFQVGTNAFRASITSNNNIGNATINTTCVSNASVQSGVCACNAGFTDSGGVCTGSASVPAIINITTDTGRSFIRQGDTVDLRIEISGASPECTIAGPGVTASDNPLIDSASPLNAQSVMYTSVPLSNYSRFMVNCTRMTTNSADPDFNLSQDFEIRVVPSVRDQ